MPSSGCKKCALDRKSTRLNSSHTIISYAVFCLKKTDFRPEPYVPCPPRHSPHHATCAPRGPRRLSRIGVGGFWRPCHRVRALLPSFFFLQYAAHRTSLSCPPAAYAE